MYCTATHMIGSAIHFLFTFRMRMRKRMGIEYEQGIRWVKWKVQLAIIFPDFGRSTVFFLIFPFLWIFHLTCYLQRNGILQNLIQNLDTRYIFCRLQSPTFTLKVQLQQLKLENCSGLRTLDLITPLFKIFNFLLYQFFIFMGYCRVPLSTVPGCGAKAGVWNALIFTHHCHAHQVLAPTKIIRQSRCLESVQDLAEPLNSAVFRNFLLTQRESTIQEANETCLLKFHTNVRYFQKMFCYRILT